MPDVSEDPAVRKISDVSPARLLETREIDGVFRHQSSGRRWIDDTSSGNIVFDNHEIATTRGVRERGAPFRRHNRAVGL